MYHRKLGLPGVSNIIVVPNLEDDPGVPICDGRAMPPVCNACMPWPSTTDDLGLTVIIKKEISKY